MIDTHCHLFAEYYDDLDEVIKKCDKHIIIVSGTNDETNNEVLEICKKYDNVFGTLGIHPSEIDSITEKSIEFIEANITNPKIVGIGEIGLDYYWIKDNKEEQKKVFIKQIKLARKYNKAIVVHSRDSINDTYEIIKNYAKGLKINLHCFNSSIDMAKKFINLNAKLGIGGVLTFENTRVLKDVVREINLSDLLLETDSPYLTPVPNRGKKNEPYNVRYVAEKIAEIKGISFDEVASTTTANAISQFDLEVNI